MPAQQAKPKTAEVAAEVFVGYVHGQAEKLDYALYTHLCHAFVVANADGVIRPNAKVPSKDFADEAHKHGVRALLSLGGWGWDAQFAKMVTDPEAESRYIDSVLQLIQDYDYDGLDLDWEYPDSREEVPGFERLARRLRTGLDDLSARKGRPMVLTMAAAAHPQTLAWLSNDFLLGTMDWVNVMTYDYAGGWAGFAGHNAPFRPSAKAPIDGRHSVTTTFEYLLDERGFPPQRLAMGLPLYGRAYSVATPYANTEGTKNAGRSVIYREASKRLGEGWRCAFDGETQVPWLVSPDGDAIVSYDDPESIALKTEWARERSLRGVFFWEVSQDRIKGNHVLQQAAKAAWESDE